MKLAMRFAFVLFSMLVSANQLRAQDCPDTCDFVMPRVASVDSENAFVQILSSCAFTEYQIQVFNRWGILVFESSDPNEEFGSGDIKDDVYTWEVELMYCNGEEVRDQGTISIIR